MTLLSQTGTVSHGFSLRHEDAGWTFTMPGADAVDPPVATVRSGRPPVTGRWTHLAAVFDAGGRELLLYVDGELAGRAPAPATAWNATGQLGLSGEKWNSAVGRYRWYGATDDVRLWQEIVSAREIRTLAERPPRLEGRWKLEGDGRDDTGHGHDLKITGAIWGKGPNGMAGAALEFDGVNDQAATVRAPVDTGQSFTVSAWVRQDDRTRLQTALCQEGKQRCGFYLQYSTYENRMRIVRPDADLAEPGFYAAGAAPAFGVWTHVTGVYDRAQSRLRYYVNGRLANTADAPGGFTGAGPLHFGRTHTGAVDGSYLLGALSDVRLFQGALSTDEVYQLAMDP